MGWGWGELGCAGAVGGWVAMEEVERYRHDRSGELIPNFYYTLSYQECIMANTYTH